MRDERMDHGDERGAALEALQRYRSTEAVTDETTSCLLSGARRFEQSAGRERRREALIERAQDGGVDRDFAELIYETAQQEGLEPAFAFELVRCGVGVQDHDHIVYGEGEDEGMNMQGPPEELIAPDERSAPAADRERRLRLSFRRLRRHIDGHATAADALLAFVAEPDVGRCEY